MGAMREESRFEINKDELWGALNTLPEPQRAALAWRDIMGEPYETVAAQMGIPLEQAKTHVIQGRMALKSALFS